jgi:hypothetical protein
MDTPVGALPCPSRRRIDPIRKKNAPTMARKIRARQAARTPFGPRKMVYFGGEGGSDAGTAESGGSMMLWSAML